MSLVIRDAAVADYDVFARLHPALEVPDPVLSAAQFAEHMLPNVILVCDDRQPIGYAHWAFYGATAHVRQVAVSAEARRGGAGRILMQELRRRASLNGCTRWYLNVKADNAAAIRLYEGSGLAIEQRGWALVCDWISLQVLQGPTRQVTFDPPELEVTRFAQQQSIEPERLAFARRRPGRVFVALRDEAGMCALAVFDPNSLSVYPVAVRRPEHARPLFEALLPKAHAPHVNIFVEGNVALAEALRTAGAKLVFETFRMGALLS